MRGETLRGESTGLEPGCVCHGRIKASGRLSDALGGAGSA